MVATCSDHATFAAYDIYLLVSISGPLLCVEVALYKRLEIVLVARPEFEIGKCLFVFYDQFETGDLDLCYSFVSFVDACRCDYLPNLRARKM